jgi:hypothetical protein
VFFWLRIWLYVSFIPMIILTSTGSITTGARKTNLSMRLSLH